ncbi:MAG: hypothetical protein ABL949_08045 [Fimbriimonadaceae bacterium]
MISLLLVLAAQDSFVPTSAYQTRIVRGFEVKIHPNLEADQFLRKEMLNMLNTKLAEIEQLIPEEPLKKLKTTKIWLDKESKSVTAAAYHPSAQWLKEHGFNPDMEKGVELGNAKNVLDWTVLNQPFMVLHELAHAYHHQHLGYSDKSVLKAFAAAKEGGKYAEVEKLPSGRGPHYGLNNEKEFFAETTEAYFGKNDFQPFDRKCLKAFDPGAYEMIEKAWEIKPSLLPK